MLITLVLLTTLILISIFLLHWLRKLNYYYWKKRGIAYYESPPIFGIVWYLISKGRGFQNKLDDIYEYKTDEKLVGFFQFSTPTVMIRDPDIIKYILMTDFNNFADRFRPLYGKDMFSCTLGTLSGDKWRKTRRAIVGGFSCNKLKIMIPQIFEISRDLFDVINEQNSKPIAIKELLNDFSITLHAKTLFSFDLNLLKNRDDSISKEMSVCTSPFSTKSFGTLVKFIFAITGNEAITRMLKLEFFHNDNLFCSIVKELKKQRNNEDFKRNDILQSMLDKNNFSDHEIAAQMFGLIITAKDVFATIFTFILYHLTIYPEVQEEIYDKLTEFLNNSELTYETLKSLTFLDQIIYETLRLYPQGTPMYRKSKENYKIPGSNIIIDKGTQIMLPFGHFCKDPKYFPEPNKFDFNRFKNGKEEFKYVFAPYGLGPRNCVAWRGANIELKLLLALFIKNYKIKNNLSSSVNLAAKYSLFNQAEEEIQFIFEKRII